MPGFVVMELIQDADNKDRVRKAMKLVEPLPIVWPTPAHCDTALATFREFLLSHSLGLLDALRYSFDGGAGRDVINERFTVHQVEVVDAGQIDFLLDVASSPTPST